MLGVPSPSRGDRWIARPSAELRRARARDACAPLRDRARRPGAPRRHAPCWACPRLREEIVGSLDHLLSFGELVLETRALRFAIALDDQAHRDATRHAGRALAFARRSLDRSTIC